MIIFPAIDIKDGKVVRLVQGKFDKVTEYGQDPVTVAKHWESQGAQWLHVVDLDGAQTGQLKNFDTIKKIAQSVNIPIQIGGGIRNKNVIHILLDLDELGRTQIHRIVLGSVAIENRSFDEKDNLDFKNFLKENILSKTKYADRLAISIDCANGFVASRGWEKPTDIKGADFAREMADNGVRWIIYTDIARDGMLTGPNIQGLEEILKAVKDKTSVIASGGISGIKDIQKLLELKSQYPNLVGAITGKAIYEGKLDLKEAIELCSQKG